MYRSTYALFWGWKAEQLKDLISKGNQHTFGVNTALMLAIPSLIISDILLNLQDSVCEVCLQVGNERHIDEMIIPGYMWYQT